METSKAGQSESIALIQSTLPGCDLPAHCCNFYDNEQARTVFPEVTGLILQGAGYTA
ncbi:hypothetical protein [Methanolobus chelungpuianus]|uniref:hypothetical protein n=1 Tax=Methanolobus chelungpuianus TaxID=502115 RepID=UPI0021152F62|nr:hypothetical protein [Methanolobus chelungpuianus]